ncbi:uncharacterized protein CNMaR [Drosophila tropicalis]|uniref:uncharacterized protein CNMaR n=1 Tax=Drosophila tropicalis TaxID=46794 RepID=UPI0035AB6E52
MHKMRPQQQSSATATAVPSSNSSSSGVNSYRITSSLKRQKSTGTHPSGQHSVASRQQQQQQQQQETSPQALEKQQEHEQKQQLEQHINSCPHHCEIVQKPGRRKVTNSSQLKVTKMLLIVSTVFVFLNLPSCLLRIQVYWESKAEHTENLTVALQYVFHALFVTNFGINFVLYCVSGQNFRKAVLSIFRRVSSAQREGTTQVTVSEYSRNTGTSTRRRMMTQHCWNELHELHPLK